jgi:hypothetical protein
VVAESCEEASSKNKIKNKIFPNGVYPSRFFPIEKIGKELGWQHCKRLVKIGKKRLEKGLAKD